MKHRIIIAGSKLRGEVYREFLGDPTCRVFTPGDPGVARVTLHLLFGFVRGYSDPEVHVFLDPGVLAMPQLPRLARDLAVLIQEGGADVAFWSEVALRVTYGPDGKLVRQGDWAQISVDEGMRVLS